MLVQLWRARLRYYQRYHGPLYNRVVRWLVRNGVARDRTFEPVRQLAK